MRKLSNEYIAGFMDGEGYIGGSKASRDGMYRFHVSVSQVKPAILYLIHKQFGGNLTYNKHPSSKNARPFHGLQFYNIKEQKKLSSCY